MAQQHRLKRRTHQQALVENGVITLDIPRGYDIESFFFRISGTATLTTAGTAVRALAPTQLIKRVEIIADGKNTIASIPGWAFVKNFQRNQHGYMLPPTAAAIAAYAVEFSGFLDQAMIDGVRPKDSNLRTNGMSLLQLRITTGACVDLFTGAPAGSMSNFQIEVGLVETQEYPDAKGVITKPLYLRKRSYQDLVLPASNANQQVILPVGNWMRGVTILATINGEPSNAVINAVQLVSGVDVRLNLPGTMLQRMNSPDYDPIGLLSNTAGPAASTINPTGLYVVDMMRNGPTPTKVSDAWDLRKASEAKLVLDVAGGAGYQLTIVTEEFVK